jgi:large subunit ribosomal protein L15
MPLYRRVPKRGFAPRNRRVYALVNLKALGLFPAGSVVDPDQLAEAGIIKKSERGLVKLLGDGELAHALTVKVHAVSQSAREKVEAAGGAVEVVPA